ncbi:conjugal transfer protein [Cronobacter sakazakii]|uniref:conjugal transfer protein n=1 Tax=Cronobacter sakazakii TaxID=28141 RepID=UPI0029377C11|nr:conjugal transfer protein [Cronobacter sakazakii]EKS1073448.1 conjugal transfer protein [Cronobacter sakazakii]EKS1087126.1 conjugal transfer protein [Cronobacter sakazakii]ELQ5973802.1 conjugal transfer protein [Cronobacter sakazakii]ELQ6034822.1 conjugal transfer protein [Cronobacter sakazakii]ELQ6043537.1 conjugal transfer protein [Cronobacter sakazakii]
MSDKKNAGYPPGFWRDAGRPLSVYGIPSWLFLLYLFWFRFPSMDTLYMVSALIVFFRLLQMFGWGATQLISRGVRMARGKSLSGRPWWYRRYIDGE